jgi:hypothetical protein
MVEIVDLMPTAIELFGAYSIYLLARCFTLRYVAASSSSVRVFYSTRMYGVYLFFGASFDLFCRKKRRKACLSSSELRWMTILYYTVLYYTVLNYLAVCRYVSILYYATPRGWWWWNLGIGATLPDLGELEGASFLPLLIQPTLAPTLWKNATFTQ